MGNIIGETDCISSRYSNEVESEMEEGKKREKKENWASFDAMHLIKNKR